MSHALTVTETGGTDVLTLTPQEQPTPGAGEVVVEVAASGVNFIDVYQREGRYPMDLPFTLGMEGAGTVVAVGEGVTEPAVGDVVAWAMTVGSAATYAVVPADRTAPVPDGVDPVVAAAAMLQGMTAHFLVNSTYEAGPDTVALVHAAAGGVGQLLVQMLKAKGATVIATAGGPEKCETARARGADAVIDYNAVDDLAAAVREAAGRGVDVAYDGVGAATFDASLASLRPRGLLVIFGAASGAVPPFDVQRLNTGGSLYVTRPTLGNYIADRDELLWRAGEVLDAVKDGSLDIAIGGRYALSDAGAAYDALEGRATQGKLVLLP